MISLAYRGTVVSRSIRTISSRLTGVLFSNTRCDRGLQQGQDGAVSKIHISSRALRCKVAETSDMSTGGAKPVPKYRKDYTPTPYLIDQINLEFLLNEDVTRVTSTISFKPNHSGGSPEMCLNGREDVELISVAINGEVLPASAYARTDKFLTIPSPPEGEFELTTVSNIKPQENTMLEGLYKSSGNFCTQCEAEGFRGITFTYDRPDVMSKYRVHIDANKEMYPVLLSNGNMVDSGDLPGGRHFTVWEDPFPKPCYLFALVAGKLSKAEDKFVTASGKNVALHFYTEEKDIGKVQWAIESLKQAMRWDEERYGLEYDLDLFNVVSVSDFSMGAMENKSLNIFNSRLVLASPETATDADFTRIQGVIGHEYFHNWTGNRVTCRDWFQLTLKEGLTVYRDSEFTSDMASRPVKRIEDVMILRTAQFSQDAGPIAHPIRPESYIKMDNFYTVTVYEKGAEVVRMYETVLGRDGFRKGMDLYFQRHDGCAVTCDDFLAAMADANGEDLSALSRWYGQAGTPELTVATSYNGAAKTLTITTHQKTPATPDQPEKVPLLIPIKVGLLGPDGAEMPFTVSEGKYTQNEGDKSSVLLADSENNKFVLSGVESKPVPSLLRDFSAPVKMTVEGQSESDLVFIMANDTDPFNRLAKGLLLNLYDKAMASGSSDVESVLIAAGGVSQRLIDAYRSILKDPSIDGSTAAMTLTLPGQSEMVQTIPEADPTIVHAVRRYVTKTIAQQLMPELLQVLKENDSEPGGAFSAEPAAMAKRAYKNTALRLLTATGDESFRADCLSRFRAADNMTDSIAAIEAVNDIACPEKEEMLTEFFNKWEHEELVMLKWLTMQSRSNMPGNLANVQALVSHPKFKMSNPNSCYSLFLGFASSPANFHAADGSGYEFLADMVLKVDKLNHQVAARIAGAFTTYQQIDTARQTLIKAQLGRILKEDGLSENVQEIVSKSLQAS